MLVSCIRRTAWCRSVIVAPSTRSTATRALFHRIHENLMFRRASATTSSSSSTPTNPVIDPSDNGSTSAKNHQRALGRILLNLNVFVEELSHMDEVRVSQNRVMQLKDRLFETGQRKRDILHNLSNIRRDLKRAHLDSVAVGTGTESYMAVIKLLKSEEQLQATYDQADLEERNLFTHLTAAINDSYEKEKVHANTLRLWGLIGTILTSTITLILSTIGHYYHTTQIGLVGSKFRDADSIFHEIHKLRDLVANLTEEQRNSKHRDGGTPTESWSAYLSRHTNRAFRYFYPKSK